MTKFTQKLACLFMVMLCCVSLQVMAQSELTVADSTATSSYVPAYGLYADTQNARSQCLYPSDLLTGMNGGTISQMTFYLSSPATDAWTGTFQVSIGETDETSLSNGWIEDDLTVVYTGAMDATGTTLTVVFEDGYTYNGGNLVFDWLVTTAGNFKNASFYGASLTGASRYRNSGTAAGSVVAYLPKCTFEYTPGGGLVVVCDKPDDPVVTDITANSAMLAIAGGSQTYNIEIKGGAYDDWTFLTKNTTNTSIPLTGLTPYTSYQIRVQSTCDGGVTSGYKTVSFKTLIGIPYVDALATQGEWTKKQGLLSDIMSGMAFGTGTGTWNFGARAYQPNVLGGPHAYMNLYGTSCKNWIISPMIPLPEGGNYVLTYQVALTDYNNENPIENPTLQQDDKLVVLVSADSCHTWSILQQWDNQGSPYVYNAIPTTGEEVEIDLSAYAGQEIQIAFYGESTVSGNGDNDIHVGHVLIDYAPSCMTPDGLVAANATKTSLQLDWNAKSGETAWILQYKKPSAEEYTSLDITQKPYTLQGLEEFTEYQVRVAGKCSDAEDGTSKFCKPVTFKTASGVPFLQTFDTANLVSEWVRYEALLSDVLNEGATLESTNKGWDVAAANGIFPSADYHLVLNLKDSTSRYWIVGPTIEMEANQQLTFDLAFTKAAGNKQAVETGKQNSQKFYVFITTDNGATWTDIAKWTNSGEGFSLDGINTEGQTAKIDLAAYATNSIKLAFYGESTNPTDASNNLHIANVKVAEIPACSKPTSLTITGVTGTTATAVWESDEDGVWQYGYVVKPTGDFVPADSLFIGTTSATTYDMTGLTETTHYLFFVRHICDNDTSEALVKEFATIQTPTDLPYEQDFETANGWKLINGELENHWVWGESARANNTPSGSKALYISNDNLGTYAYTRGGTGKAAMVYAVKTFYFDQAGMYSFQYDWKCWGYSSYDYLRVALIPADVELEAGTTVLSGFSTTALPEGWTALDGGSKLNLDSAWNHQLVELTVDKAGYYQMVFAWRNYTYTSGKNPPAAVDNIKIARITCTKPSHLTYADLTASGVTFNWDAVDGASFDYALVTEDEDSAFLADPVFIEVPGGANSIQFDTLAEKTNYKFYLRKVCGGEDGNSDVISIEFKTKPLPYAVPWSENFNDMTANAIPEYWDNTASTAYESTTTKYYIWGVYNYSAGNNKMLRMYNSLVKTGTALINTPQIALPASPVCALSFDYSNLANCGAFTVKISEDGGLNWVDLKSFEATGSTNTTNPGTFTPAEIRLEGYEGKTIMLQFFANANYGSGAIFVDNIKIEEAPSCVRPTDLAVIDSLTTTTSVTIVWTPGLNETNWLVQYKKSADSVWTFVPDSVLSDTLVLAGLEASSAYDVRVAAWCDTADSTAISDYSIQAHFITECDVITVFPYKEGFDSIAAGTSGTTNILPICWNAINTTSYSSYKGYPTLYKSASYANTPDNSLKFYSYAYGNSSTDYDPQDQYAILPEMEGISGLRIKLNARKYSASYDATFTVGVMTDPADVTTYVVVDTISPTSANYESFVVPFNTASSDARFIAIKMEGVEVPTTSTAAYRGVHIDDIVVEEIPNCIEPNNLTVVDSLVTMNSAVLTWTAQGNETEWIFQYKKHADAEWTSVPATNDTILLENLESATRYDARVAAKCSETDLSPFTDEVYFVTACGAYSIVNQGAYTEGFEDYAGAAYNATTGVIPNCWDAVSTGTVAPHVITPSDTYAYIHTGEKALTFYGSGYCYAALPEFAEPLNTLQISFWAAMESASNGTLTLGYITNETGIFHEIATYSRTTAKVMAPYETVLTAVPDSAARLVFQWYYSSQWSCCIDDIKVSIIPNCLKPTNLEAALTKGDGSVATLNWKAGKNETAWAVEYSLNEDFSDSVYVEVTDSTLALTGLISDSTYYARVKAICSETEESEWSNVISFTPMNAIIINDGTTTSSYVPFYGYYVDMGTNSQFIIPEKEIATIQWDTITQLTFYCSSTYANQSWSGSQFEVYVAETTDTVLNAMLNWTDMKKIMNSKHIEVVNQQMVVTLDKPFQYQGGNLVIGIKESVTGTEGYCYWYGKSGVSGNSIYLYGSNPTGSGTKSTFNPKVKIDHVHGEMPTCFVVKDITVSDITPSSAVLNWTPGEEGQNAWQIVYSADPAFDLASIAPEDIHDVTALPYALAELATDTLYNVYVRANCSEEGNEDYSMWSELFTFHTASSCQTPDNVKADSIFATSALINWNTYGQTLFNLLYTDGTAMDTLYSVECPYLLEGLTPSTAYGIKVQAACAGESGSWSSLATFKTAYGTPFEEKFNETTIPTDWNQYSGLLSDILAGTKDLSSASLWYFGANNGVFDSHARVNIYGTSRYQWLVTPNINLTGDVQLTFDLALTKYSGTAVAVDTTQQADDKFVVLASTDNGATWTILRQWDNAGSAYVYNNIATTGEEVALDLSAYTGQSVMIAFYGESTETGGDNNLHIDNVLIDKVPTCLKPTGLSVSEVKAHKAKIAWTAAEGQDAWQIAYATKATEKPDTLANILDVTANPYVLENLDPSTTYYVYVRANCGEQDGMSKWTDGKSFKTTVACPAPTNLQAVLTPGNGTIATLKWTAGGDEQSWRVEYSTNANMSDSVAVVVDDTIYNLTGLTSETTYYARVLADCGELDSLSVYSTKIEFTPTSAYRLTVNDGTMTNYYVPIYGSYVDEGTRSQFIIPEADLEELEWDSIKSLTFYASQDTVIWSGARFEIYLAEAPETTISEEVDWTAMTLVKHADSLSIADHKMVVTFDSAYQYQGGNLMIGFYQTVNGTYNAASWYGVKANGASMGGYGFGNNYTQRNFLPKMMIDYVPGVAPACPNPKNLQVVSVAADSAVFSWKAVEGASWEYAVALASAAEPTEFNAVPAGANAIVVNGLSELTSYVFYLRRACGEDGNSEIVSVPFETLEIAEEISYSYNEDFEAATGWKLINGTETNAWMIGSATSNGGDNALYISSDGAAYAYDEEAASVTYASKLFHFVRTGTFSVSYDYKCVGEYNDEDGALDYLRVALIPSDVALTAGVQLSDLVQPLDHDSALVAQSAWTRKSAIASIPAVGMYRLVFIWSNDDVDSDGAPAAIDNISIMHKDNPTDSQSGAGIENKAVKFIYNNQVYILLNGNVYNITGQKVELR